MSFIWISAKPLARSLPASFSLNWRLIQGVDCEVNKELAGWLHPEGRDQWLRVPNVSENKAEKYFARHKPEYILRVFLCFRASNLSIGEQLTFFPRTAPIRFRIL